MCADVRIGKDMVLVQKLEFSDFLFMCSPGAIPQDNVCGEHVCICDVMLCDLHCVSVNCPVGTFFNIVSKECIPCSAGSYQPEEAQVPRT